MRKLADFVSKHGDEDTARLILDRAKWPDIDMDTAVNCIESRRKLKGKVQEWYENPDLIFPVRISAEQCSSSATAEYKAALAERILCTTDGLSPREWNIADLTGGLGVDSWFFSKKAAKVLYNEMQQALCEAARHNFAVLHAGGIEICNSRVTSGNIREILAGFQPDMVYMDPARRGEGGRKVFLIEECTPDVLTLKDEIFTMCRHIMIKLSPMADIDMVCRRLGPSCREIHVISSGGECKELLIWMDREWEDEYTITAVEIHDRDSASSFCFLMSEEKGASHIPMTSVPECGGTSFLFEPGKSLMKSGAFNLISARYGLPKFGMSTHYYLVSSAAAAEGLTGLGKIYAIIRCESLDKRTVKAAGRDFPRSEVTARNLPMDTETLRKKLGITSGDDAHIFGLKSDVCGNLLLCTKRVLQQDLQADANEDDSSCQLSL